MHEIIKIIYCICNLLSFSCLDVVRGNLKVTLNLCHKIRQGLAVRGKEEVSSKLLVCSLVAIIT